MRADFECRLQHVYIYIRSGFTSFFDRIRCLAVLRLAANIGVSMDDGEYVLVVSVESFTGSGH